MRVLFPHLKTYFSFSKKENLHIWVSAIIFAFILNFRKWGEGTFDLSQGISNLIFAFIVVVIGMYFHISIQKIIAVYLGYKAEHSFWLNGLLLCLVIAFMSNGFIPLLFFGTIKVEHLEKLRLGKFRYGLNYRDLAVTSVAGPIASLLLVLITAFFYLPTEAPALLRIININLALAFFALLPIPTVKAARLGEGGTAGFNILYYSRALYVFCLASVIVYYLLITIAKFSSLIVAFIFAGMCTYVFIKRIEE